MSVLPTTGEMRFSAIGTEFSDPYSLTDSAKTIRLSHYFKNIQHIPTSHINTFPNSFDKFKLSLFRGKQRFIPPPPLPEQTDPFPEPQGAEEGFGNVAGYMAEGLEVTNLTGIVRNPNNSNNSFIKIINDLDNNVTSPETILQAIRGDIIKVKTFQRTFYHGSEYAKWLAWVYIWLYNGSSWIKLDRVRTSLLSYEFENRYRIDLEPGNYAIGMSLSRWHYNDPDGDYIDASYRSWRAFSVHVWA